MFLNLDDHILLFSFLECPPGCSNCWVDVTITSDDPMICYACEDDLILDEAGVCVAATSDSSPWNMY